MSNNIAAELKEVGAHYTLSKRRRHPSVLKFLEQGKSRPEFKIDEIAAMFEKALLYIEECGKNNKTVLLVSSRDESLDLLRETAEALSMPYVAGRWIGGTISNFDTIKTRFVRLSKLKSEDEGEGGRKLTKKEYVLRNREIAKLESRFSGILTLTRKPDAIFILDTNKQSIALAEALKTNIPIIGFSNANANIKQIKYPILGNTTSRKAVEYVLGKVRDAYKNGAKNSLN